MFFNFYVFFCWLDVLFYFFLFLFFFFFLYDCFNKNLYFVKYLVTVGDFSFSSVHSYGNCLIKLFILYCEIDGISKKNDLDFSCSDKMESELSYHDFDESCESAWSIYLTRGLYLFRGRKDRSWFVQEWNCICDERTGITGHPVETVASFNSCFSQRRKWTGKRDKTSNQWRGSNSVRIFLKLIFLSHLVEST